MLFIDSWGFEGPLRDFHATTPEAHRAERLGSQSVAEPRYNPSFHASRLSHAGGLFLASCRLIIHQRNENQAMDAAGDMMAIS